IVTPERFLVLVEIGRILHVERQPALGRGCNMAAGRGLERTKVAGKCALFIVGQAVIVEHQYGVAVHAGLDRIDFITRQRPRDVHTGHLAGELGIERANAECHHEDSCSTDTTIISCGALRYCCLPFSPRCTVPRPVHRPLSRTAPGWSASASRSTYLRARLVCAAGSYGCAIRRCAPPRCAVEPS